MSDDGPLLAPETPDLVWFRGPDAIRFLNDIISQEIATKEPGSVVRSLLLEPQGKLSHILWVLRGDDEVGLITDPGRGDDLTDRLSRYRIRVDVEIEPERSPAALVVGEWTAEPGRWIREDGRVTADVSWPDLSRWYLTGAIPDLGEMSAEDYETERVAAGEPKWGRDVDDSTIPHESGLVADTVDFTKGCFLGQELVARIDSRGGNVPRRLWLLDLGGVPGEAGSGVSVDGDEIGEITSRAGPIAIARLKRGVEPGDEVMVGGAHVEVLPLR